MAAPNIVNVTTITGVTTFHAGIAATTGGKGDFRYHDCGIKCSIEW